MFVIGVLFTLALGPFFGVQIVEATQDGDLYVIFSPLIILPQLTKCDMSGLRSPQRDLLPLLPPHVGLSEQAEEGGGPALGPGRHGLDHLRLDCLAQEGLH